MSRPILARIDLSALSHNLQVARRATSARVMAAIKANAYGHGTLQAAQALRSADGFALLDVQEAIRLRESGFSNYMLMLEGAFSPEEMPLLAEYGLACVVRDPHQVRWLDAYPKREGLDVWLKMNTGMNRLGFPLEQYASVLETVSRHRAVRSVTLMTHFACADERGGVVAQLERFNALSGRMPRSLANSAALLRHPETHADWVRPGIMLYGASPFDDQAASDIGLRPAMTLESRLISVRSLAAGDRVGYGATFTAPVRMRIGVVACGYADGYPRHAGTGTPVLVNGRRTRTLGRVSMDMLAVDLTDVPDADVGSLVTLWGDRLPVEEVAAAAGTISYELLCALAPRVPKIFL